MNSVSSIRRLSLDVHVQECGMGGDTFCFLGRAHLNTAKFHRASHNQGMPKRNQIPGGSSSKIFREYILTRHLGRA
jgi:hypothetical protein